MLDVRRQKRRRRRRASSRTSSASGRSFRTRRSRRARRSAPPGAPRAGSRSSSRPCTGPAAPVSPIDRHRRLVDERLAAASNSASVPTSGIMISGCGSPPPAHDLGGGLEDRPHLHLVDLRVRDARAGSRDGRASGSTRGAASTRSREPLGGDLSSAAVFASAAGSFGRNSWSGGSSRRIVTGRSPISRKMPTKSSRCIGRIFASAARRPSADSARIISRTARMRSSSKNMCSVRQSPMPSRAEARPRRARRSACPRWRGRRDGGASSAQSRIRSNARKIGRLLRLERLLERDLEHLRRPRRQLVRGCTSPVVPSIEIQSPSVAWRLSRAHLLPRLVDGDLARARRRTSCPCRAPRRPRATSCRRASSGFRRPRSCPAMSSGEVSSRTRTTGFPSAAISTARSRRQRDAAGRRARAGGQPLAEQAAALRSPRPSPSDRRRARAAARAAPARRAGAPPPRVISPSSTMSVAMRTAANPVRLPLRVCSM